MHPTKRFPGLVCNNGDKSNLYRPHHRYACKAQQEIPKPQTDRRVTKSGLHESDQQTISTAGKQQSATFTDLYPNQLPPWLLSRLRELGFTNPTQVQSSTLEIALPMVGQDIGSDVVIHAQTGSGKTLAYLLPAIAAVEPSRACVQSLIVVPTQELGMQVYRLLRRLTSVYKHSHNIDAQLYDDADLCFDMPSSDQEAPDVVAGSFPVLPMLNQADLRRQKLQLRQLAPRIIVGNPHRIAELVSSGRLRLELLKLLVVDEFDACLLDTSTTCALQTILSVRYREGDRQTILASATVPQHRHFLRQCVRQRWTRADIKHVWVEEESGIQVPESLEHWYAVCESRKKLAALRLLLLRMSENSSNEGNHELSIRAMVFVMASRNITEIVESLNKSLVANNDGGEKGPVVGISDDSSIVHRKMAMKRFRSGDASVLISTDLAARGLDVAEVSHVFHFDLPRDADSYLHRAGRAGRQGRHGTSVVLISRGEEFVVNRTSNKLGIQFQRIGQ